MNALSCHDIRDFLYMYVRQVSDIWSIEKNPNCACATSSENEAICMHFARSINAIRAFSMSRVNLNPSIR